MNINSISKSFGQTFQQTTKISKLKPNNIIGQFESLGVTKKQLTDTVHFGNKKPPAEVASFTVKKHNSANGINLEELKKRRKEIHAKRMEIYSTSEPFPSPMKVNSKKLKAMKDVQYEMGEYDNVKKKTRLGIKLNQNEQKFYDDIVAQMDETTEEKILYRIITPYEGFEEEIRTGKYEFKGLTSTCSRYNDFFDFWICDEFNPKEKSFVEGYILQITVPKGKKILDCNAFQKNFIGKPHYTRMRGEVVLPECVAEVTGIEDELNVIKLRLL